MFARSLRTTFTAGVLATSLALAAMTPTSASARMSEDEIAALLGLLVIGAAIHNSRNDDRPSTPAPAPAQQRPNRNWQVLPSQCLTTVETRRGQAVRMFGQRCLNRNYQHTNRLPAACQVQVRSENGNRRQGYRANCMRNQGFRMSRR